MRTDRELLDHNAIETTMICARGSEPWLVCRTPAD